MIIQSSSIGMNSARRYNSSQKSYSAISVWNNNQSAETLEDKPAEKGYTNVARRLLSAQDAYNVSSTNKSTWGNVKNAQDAVSKIRQQTLDYLLYLLFGRKPDYTKGVDESEDCDASLTEMPVNAGNATQTQLPEEEAIGGQYYGYFEYSEMELTSFNTTGTVVTADGQQIDFDVSLTMSHSFYMQSQSIVDFGAPRCCDPLVINLDCSAAEVTDQKFYFDLDADGNEEYISMLGAGSGYLALDKNGDGTINDGSELFGTASGNGFADLAAYDTDGNGWIDEADEIFDKLQIWRVDENGESSLCGLGKAGVGAIYLGSQESEFSLKNAGNTTNAIIRSTGMFLYENGGVGTIQQLDLAT